MEEVVVVETIGTEMPQNSRRALPQSKALQESLNITKILMLQMMWGTSRSTLPVSLWHHHKGSWSTSKDERCTIFQSSKEETPWVHLSHPSTAHPCLRMVRQAVSLNTRKMTSIRSTMAQPYYFLEPVRITLHPPSNGIPSILDKTRASCSWIRVR